MLPNTYIFKPIEYSKDLRKREEELSLHGLLYIEFLHKWR